MLAVAMLCAATGYAQATKDNPLDMVEGNNSCPHTQGETYHKCWWKYTATKDVVLYLSPKNYASLDVREIVPADAGADTLQLTKASLPNSAEAYPVKAGVSVMIGESGSDGLSYDASFRYLQGMGTGIEEANPLIVEQDTVQYMGMPRGTSGMQTTYARFTATSSGVLVLSSPAYVVYCSVNGGPETSFFYNNGSYTYNLPVTEGEVYNLTFRNYNPFLFSANMTYPEPGTPDLPFAIADGENTVPAAAGTYYYTYTNSEGGFANITANATLPGGQVKVFTSRSGITYDNYTAKSNTGEYAVRWEAAYKGTTYFITVTRAEAAAADETFTFAFEPYQVGSKEENPIVITEVPATQTVAEPGATVYYAVDVPAGTYKYLVVEATSAIASTGTKVAIYKPGNSYSAPQGNTSISAEVDGGESGQRYIVRWVSSETGPIDFKVSYVDILQGDVIGYPLVAVAGENTIADKGTGTKYYKFTASRTGKLLFEGTDAMAVTFPKGTGKYDGNYDATHVGNSYYMAQTEGTSYLIKIDNVEAGDKFTVTEADFAEGESRDNAINVTGGTYTLGSEPVTNLWLKYTVKRAGCILSIEGDMPYSGDNIVQYGKSTDTYLSNMMTTEVVGTEYVTRYFTEVAAANEEVYLVNLTLPTANEGKTVKFVERDFELGEGISTAIQLQNNTVNYIPQPSRTKPMWCKVSLKAGNITMKPNGYVEGYWFTSRENAISGQGEYLDAVRSWDPNTGDPVYTISYDISEGSEGEYYIRLDNGSGSAVKLQVSGDAVEETVNPFPHRKMYGFYLRNDNLDGYGLCSLYMDNLGSAEMISQFGDGESVYCGAFAGDTWYGMGYIYNLMSPPSPDYLISINLQTGEKTKIGRWTDADNYGLRFQDMTYDYASGTMYAIGFSDGYSSLYTVDLTTGMSTRLIPLEKTLGTIAADKDGTLYGAAHDGCIYKVDKASGALTKMFDTQLTGGMPSNQTMEFDHTTGLLYWASCIYGRDEGKDTYLVVIDLKNNKMYDPNSNDNIMGAVASFEGMYIPFVEAGLQAPAAPENLVVTPGAEGAKTASLTWNAPTKTYGGNYLADISKVTVKRNNEEIATIDVTTMGKAMTFTDTQVPDNGTFKYSVYATNSVGDGEEAILFPYIGIDYPSCPLNVNVDTQEGCGAAIITWDKPAGSTHGGYYDEAGLTYKVTRYPDEAVVAEGLQGTSFTDDSFRRLAKYYYEIAACNEVGSSSATSTASIYGPAMELPVVEALDDITAFLNTWSTIDGNGDAYTWMFNTGLDSYQFGWSARALEYIINPTYTPLTITSDADEWVVTPPLNFVEGKEYQISFQTRNMSTEDVEVYTGKTNLIEDLDLLEQISLEAVPEGSDGNVPFVTTVVKLPAMTGVNCVGIRLCSPIPELMNPAEPYSRNPSYFEITNFSVSEAVPDGITSAADAGPGISFSGNTININGQFDKAVLYDAAGRMMQTVTSGTVNADSLNGQVGVLVVTQGANTKVYKVKL